MKIFERKMVTQELEIENSCYNELKKSIFPTKFQFPLSSVLCFGSSVFSRKFPFNLHADADDNMNANRKL